LYLRSEAIGNVAETDAVETLEPLIIGKTNHGRPTLCLDGYFYTIERQNSTKMETKWKCERSGNASVPKCNGRVTTKYKNDYFYGPVIINRGHDYHQPEPEKTACESSEFERRKWTVVRIQLTWHRLKFQKL
jgi:hypothetical protein